MKKYILMMIMVAFSSQGFHYETNEKDNDTVHDILKGYVDAGKKRMEHVDGILEELKTLEEKYPLTEDGRGIVTFFTNPEVLKFCAAVNLNPFAALTLRQSKDFDVDKLSLEDFLSRMLIARVVEDGKFPSAQENRGDWGKQLLVAAEQAFSEHKNLQELFSIFGVSDKAVFRTIEDTRKFRPEMLFDENLAISMPLSTFFDPKVFAEDLTIDFKGFVNVMSDPILLSIGNLLEKLKKSKLNPDQILYTVAETNHRKFLKLLGEFEATISGLTEKTGVLQGTIAGLQGEKDELHETAKLIASNLSSFLRENNVIEISRNPKALLLQTSDAINVAMAKKATLEATIAGLTAEKATLQGQFDALNEKTVALEHQVRSKELLLGDVSTFLCAAGISEMPMEPGQMLQTLKKVTESFEDEKGTLQGANATLTAEKATLQGQFDALNGQNAALADANAALKRDAEIANYLREHFSNIFAMERNPGQSPFSKEFEALLEGKFKI